MSVVRAPLEEWVGWESGGYAKTAAVPDYRISPLELTGTFIGPCNSSYSNAPVSFRQLPAAVRKSYEAYECRSSIAAVEDAIASTESGTRLVVATGDLRLALSDKVYQGMHCASVWGEVNIVNFVELLNSVRNRVMDLSLAVGKETPEAGEQGVRDPTTTARITQIFNTAAYGGSVNVIGRASNSIIGHQVIVNDFDSLAQFLSQQEVQSDDIRALQTALRADAPPTEAGLFGNRVSSWIGRMIVKAADGTWQVAIGAAGALLTTAIGRYYGLTNLCCSCESWIAATDPTARIP